MKLYYCPECGAKLAKQDISKSAYKCENGHYYWNNAKAAVGIVFLNNDQILFSKRRIEPKKGKYDLPGGFVDFNENADEAIVREAYEETNLEITNPTLLTTYKNIYIENVSTCDIIFITTMWSGIMKAKDDSESLEWKPISFAQSDEFAWNYPNLYEKISEYKNNTRT